MIPDWMRELMDETIAPAKADVCARAKAKGQRMLDPSIPAEAEQIERNRKALMDEMPSAEEMIEAVPS